MILRSCVLGLLVVGAAGCLSPKEFSELSEVARGRRDGVVPAGEKPLAVSATQLMKDYEKNEVSADAKYKGKVLDVTGKVARVEKRGDDAVVKLYGINGGIGLSTVNCTMSNRHEGEVASVEADKKVTLRCVGDGTTLNPENKFCELVP